MGSLKIQCTINNNFWRVIIRSTIIELNFTTCLKSYSYPFGNNHIFANDIKPIGLINSIFGNCSGQKETSAYVKLCLLSAIILINGVIIFIKTVFISETNIEVYEIIVGTICINNDFKILIAGFSYGVSTDVRKLHGGIYKSEVRISQCFVTNFSSVSINRYVYVRCNATSIMKRDVKTNGFTCINNTIAVILVADRRAIINTIIIKIYFRSRNSCKRLINIGYRMRTISFFGQRVIRIDRTRIYDLRLNKLGGINLTVGIICSEQCGNTRNGGSRH